MLLVPSLMCEQPTILVVLSILQELHIWSSTHLCPNPRLCISFFGQFKETDCSDTSSQIIMTVLLNVLFIHVSAVILGFLNFKILEMEVGFLFLC